MWNHPILSIYVMTSCVMMIYDIMLDVKTSYDITSYVMTSHIMTSYIMISICHNLICHNVICQDVIYHDIICHDVKKELATQKTIHSPHLFASPPPIQESGTFACLLFFIRLKFCFSNLGWAIFELWWTAQQQLGIPTCLLQTVNQFYKLQTVQHCIPLCKDCEIISF